MWAACALYGLLIFAASATDPNAVWWTLSEDSFVRLGREHAKYFLAILAGAYATFYTRFSSQWSYLAGLYNQIRAAEVQTATLPQPQKKQAYEAIAIWKLDYVQDAFTLHLARKKLFASTIVTWLGHESVIEAIEREYTESERLQLQRIWSIAADRMGAPSEPTPWSVASSALPIPAPASAIKQATSETPKQLGAD